MPIICFSVALHGCLIAATKALLVTIDLLTLDFSKVNRDADDLLKAILGTFIMLVIAVVDTLSSLFILATRTGATALAGVSAVFGPTKNLFHSKRD